MMAWRKTKIGKFWRCSNCSKTETIGWSFWKSDGLFQKSFCCCWLLCWLVQWLSVEHINIDLFYVLANIFFIDRFLFEDKIWGFWGSRLRLEIFIHFFFVLVNFWLGLQKAPISWPHGQPFGSTSHWIVVLHSGQGFLPSNLHDIQITVAIPEPIANHGASDLRIDQTLTCTGSLG